ncbi:MAG TPA: hypothetical protein VKX40_15870, partial [Aequorivita sp.]|nr:hypothetical protein [Aequorivita sp.]
RRPAGVRFYVKHYIQKDGRVIKPGLTNIFRFGIKRFLVEQYLAKNKKQINKYFRSPDGMLMANSHDAIDVFKILSSNPSSGFNNHILEIPCHPAADISELENTKLKDERVVEYNLLKSDVFVKAAQTAEFVSFKEVVA